MIASAVVVRLRGHIDERQLAEIADDPTLFERLPSSVTSHLARCTRCGRLLTGHRQAARVLGASWDWVSAAAGAGLPSVTPVASVTVRPVPAPLANPRSWAAFTIVALTIAAVVVGAMLAANRPTPHPLPAPLDQVVVERNGSMFAVDVADGTETALGPGMRPAWSPDHTRLAFTAGDGLYVANADGTGRRRLGAGMGDVAWSPDGMAIMVAYPEVTVLPVDGSSGRLLPVRPWKDAGNGSWSPDGQHVAFPTGPSSAITIVPTTATGPTRSLRATDFPWQVRWSPDGSTIAYDAQGGVHLAAADGSADRVAIRHLVSEASLEWAPDGLRLAHTNTSSIARIFDVRLGKDVPFFTAPGDKWAVHAAWSPDGTRLAVTVVDGATVPGIDPTGSKASVWIVNADGTGARELVDGLSLSTWLDGADW